MTRGNRRIGGNRFGEYLRQVYANSKRRYSSHILTIFRSGGRFFQKKELYQRFRKGLKEIKLGNAGCDANINSERSPGKGVGGQAGRQTVNSTAPKPGKKAECMVLELSWDIYRVGGCFQDSGRLSWILRCE